ncbi:16671_t:CDS:2, partial [Gigaspora margarita]
VSNFDSESENSTESSDFSDQENSIVMHSRYNTRLQESQLDILETSFDSTIKKIRTDIYNLLSNEETRNNIIAECRYQLQLIDIQIDEIYKTSEVPEPYSALEKSTISDTSSDSTNHSSKNMFENIIFGTTQNLLDSNDELDCYLNLRLTQNRSFEVKTSNIEEEKPKAIQELAIMAQDVQVLKEGSSIIKKNREKP